MVLVKFPEDQKYSIIKVLRESDTASARTTARNHNYTLKVGKPRRIDIQINSLISTGLKVSIGGNLSGIDPNNPNADNESDLARYDWRERNYDFSAWQSPPSSDNVAGNSSTIFTSLIPWEYIFVDINSNANEGFNYIMYIIVS